jgi:hypothetical protein
LKDLKGDGIILSLVANGVALYVLMLLGWSFFTIDNTINHQK